MWHYGKMKYETLKYEMMRNESLRNELWTYGNVKMDKCLILKVPWQAKGCD